jgi:hypothetical protein
MDLRGHMQTKITGRPVRYHILRKELGTRHTAASKGEIVDQASLFKLLCHGKPIALNPACPRGQIVTTKWYVLRYRHIETARLAFTQLFKERSNALIAQSGQVLARLVAGLQVQALIESTLSGLCVCSAINCAAFK